MLRHVAAGSINDLFVSVLGRHMIRESTDGHDVHPKGSRNVR